MATSVLILLLQVAYIGGSRVKPHGIESAIESARLKWDEANLEAPAKALEHGYHVDLNSPNHLRRGDKIFDLKLKKDLHVVWLGDATTDQNTYTSDEERANKVAGELGVDGEYQAFKGSLKMSASRSTSSSVKTARHDFVANAMQYRATADLKTKPQAKVRKDARWLVKQRSSTPEKIVDALGEFYATQVDLGGRFTKSYIMEMTKTDTESSIETELKASYGAKMLGEVKMESKMQTSNRVGNNEAQMKTMWDCKGGDSIVWLALNGDNFDELQTKWQASFTDKNLFPFNFQLKPVWTLLEKMGYKAKAKAVKEYLEERWEQRGGAFPTKLAPMPWYNIRVIPGAQMEDGASYLNNGERHGGVDVDLSSSDDGSGRQRWKITKGNEGRADWYVIEVISPRAGNKKYLSINGWTHNVDLFESEDGSGRQRWRIIPGGKTPDGETWYTIRVVKSGTEGRDYLSTHYKGWYVDLWDRDDPEGRQKWVIPEFEIDS